MGVNLVVSLANASLSQRHPALPIYAPWLQHVWEHADLVPSGHVPVVRPGVDKESQVQVVYSNEPLPITNPYPIQVNSPRSRVTLLLELVGVVECHLRPSKDIRKRLRDHLTSEGTLIVNVPATAWGTGRFSKLDVFEALCSELVAASLNVQAPSNKLVYELLGHLRRDVTVRFIENMNVSTAQLLNIRPGSYDQTRTLYIYDNSDPQVLVLSEQDPRCSRLGIMAWEANNTSTRSSHTILINIQGAQQTPLNLDPAIVQAIKQCLELE